MKRYFISAVAGAALVGSSLLSAAPPIEQGRPTLINQSGRGILADELITDELLRQRLSTLQGQLSSEFATQDSLTQLLDRLFRMERQMQLMQGQIEELTYRLQVAERDNRERYIDLDQRLTSIQASGAQSLAGRATEVQPAQSVSADEQAQFNAARDLISERNYEGAVEALQTFITDHPDGLLLDGAYFWLGEVFTLLREFDNAREVYQKVLSDYPQSTRRNDATFKLGFLEERVGDVNRALEYYRAVIAAAPDSQLATLASQRINSLQE
ncbi:tetratricopeptide repeat protein [Salinispirillum marinum]|uniref:Cell division coordinator CpoB n=2 Tax=Saccharospirillaceae TaxID=255527 RepID=A0ABV8BCP2_9GAMM